MKRRDFLAIATTASVALSIDGTQKITQAAKEPDTMLRRRPYGRELSVIGFGGIVVMGVEQSEATKSVAWAIDQGVNYFDVAPSYGNAQERLGPALEPYRDGCFLACKTAVRDAVGARAEIEESFKLMRTDYFDLYQLHGLSSMAELDQCFAPGGAMEMIIDAREAGEIRNLGFSAHSVEVAVEAMERFNFDSVLFPFNVVCMENGNFGQAVLDQAARKNVACLGLKAIALQAWPEGVERNYQNCWYQPMDDLAMTRLAISYVLDLPVVATLPPGNDHLFKLCVQAAQDYKPLSNAERSELIAQVKGITPIFSNLA